MIDISEPLLTATTALNALVAYVLFRGRARYRNQRGVEQLNHAAFFLRSHTQALERFLADSDAPMHLKNILLNSSDAMDNKAEVLSLVEAMAHTPLRELSEEFSAETGALRSDLDNLERRNPDLARAFETAIRTGRSRRYYAGRKRQACSNGWLRASRQSATGICKWPLRLLDIMTVLRPVSQRQSRPLSGLVPVKKV